MSDSLWLHGLQHARHPCPSPSPRVCSNSSTESVIPSNHLILCCPLVLLLSIFSSIRVFSNESVCQIRWPNYWSFSFGISPSNEHLGLISSRIDGFELLVVQETQESSPTPQFKSINSSVLSFLCGLTLTSIRDYRKKLTRWTFVGKVMSLLFNILTSILKGGHSFSSKEQVSFNFMAAYPGLWWFYTIVSVYTFPNALSCTH